jgi:hypothetical protein
MARSHRASAYFSCRQREGKLLMLDSRLFVIKNEEALPVTGGGGP